MYMTFDVETNGLHGEAFAVGYKVTNNSGVTLIEGIHSCPVDDSDSGVHDGNYPATRQWLEEHVLPVLPEPDCFTTRAVRDKFFEAFNMAQMEAIKRKELFYLVSDVAYPCETGFLAQMQLDGRDMQIYPLLDVSSMLHADGFDATGTFERLHAKELPAHNPLNDARQSSRILHMVLNHGWFDGNAVQVGHEDLYH